MFWPCLTHERGLVVQWLTSDLTHVLVAELGPDVITLQGISSGIGASGRGFPGGSEVKASARNAGDLGLIPGSGRFPWRRKWQPTPVFLPGESQGRRSLVGYSPRARQESDTTERLHSLTHSLKYLMACSFCFIKLLCCHFGAD